jgi:glutaredoxin-like protein
MPLIPAKDRDELRRRFQKELKRDVTLKLFTQPASSLVIPGRECRYCGETQQLLEELVSLSPKLHLQVYDFYTQLEEVKSHGVERIPAIVMGSDGNSNLKFYGIPMGYEFVTIIEDILLLSRGVSPLKLDSRKSLRRVNQPVHIQVFVTPTCPYCPIAARLAHAIALENPLIRADVVEVEEFPLMAKVYQVRAVPKTVINQVIQFTGALPEEQFVEKVLEVGLKEPPAEGQG